MTQEQAQDAMRDWVGRPHLAEYLRVDPDKAFDEFARIHEFDLAVASHAYREVITELKRAAFADPNLLGWLREYSPLCDDAEKFTQRIEVLLSDAELRSRLRRATQGRLSTVMLTGPGLYAVRYLAAIVLEGSNIEGHEYCDASEALVIVLNAISDRVGKDGDCWLNSLKLVGQRICAPIFAGMGPSDRPYADSSYPTLSIVRDRPARKPQRRDAELSAWLAETKKLDGAGAKFIAAPVYRDLAGLRRLVKKFGALALDVIRERVTGAMIGDCKVSGVKTWTYFEDPCAEEQGKIEMAAAGIRPGDVFGAHRWAAH